MSREEAVLDVSLDLLGFKELCPHSEDGASTMTTAHSAHCSEVRQVTARSYTFRDYTGGTGCRIRKCLECYESADCGSTEVQYTKKLDYDHPIMFLLDLRQSKKCLLQSATPL